MLDRKTKDYDASEELLEDRKKNAKFFSGMFYVLIIIIFLMFAYIGSQIVTLDFSTIINSTNGTAILWQLLFILLTSGILLLAVTIFSLSTATDYNNEIRYYNILLFLRKQKGKVKK